MTPPSRTRQMLTLWLMFTVAAGILLGLRTATQRLGWVLPIVTASLVGIHGSLMIALMGTLVSLERAIALSAFDGRRYGWAFLALAGSAVGAVGLVVGGATPFAQMMIAVGNGGLALIFVVIAVLIFLLVLMLALLHFRMPVAKRAMTD